MQSDDSDLLFPAPSGPDGFASADEFEFIDGEEALDQFRQDVVHAK